jgi:hypothetical protein
VQQSPSWEANSHSDSRETPRFYGTRRFLPRSQGPATDSYPELDAANPHLPTIFPKILPSTPRSSKWSLPFRFSNQKYYICYSSISHSCYIPLLSHPAWFYYPNNIRWNIQAIKLLVMQFLQPPVPPSHPAPNVLLITLCRVLSICKRSFGEDSWKFIFSFKHPIIAYSIKLSAVWGTATY